MAVIDAQKLIFPSVLNSEGEPGGDPLTLDAPKPSVSDFSEVQIFSLTLVESRS